MNGNDIAKLLKKLKGVTIKSSTASSIVLLVDGNRIEEMHRVAKFLCKLNAVVDSNLKGSSIGGIKIGLVKILIKGAGRTGGLDVELAAISTLESAVFAAVAETGGPIKIKLGNGKTILNVSRVLKTAGTPKSDFNLADDSGKALIHISHKKGKYPKDFQQWGGLTEDRIKNHKETKAFILKCQALYGDKIPPGESAYSVIKSKDLQMMSVFGVNFDKGAIDSNRVDVLIQGDPGLKKISKGIYTLTASGHIHYHGEVPDAGFTPVLAIIYKGDRDQFNIKGARFSIYPKDGRSFKTHIT
jgi:hypothetical protein